MCKRSWIVPIPGTRHLCRLKENIGVADICLSAETVAAVDAALDDMDMSEVFGGSPVRKGLKRADGAFFAAATVRRSEICVYLFSSSNNCIKHG